MEQSSLDRMLAHLPDSHARRKTFTILISYLYNGCTAHNTPIDHLVRCTSGVRAHSFFWVNNDGVSTLVFVLFGFFFWLLYIGEIDSKLTEYARMIPLGVSSVFFYLHIFVDVLSV